MRLGIIGGHISRGLSEILKEKRAGANEEILIITVNASQRLQDLNKKNYNNS